jgi:hypothetical protein
MIKTVALVYKWSPNVLESLYFDEVDHRGLEYWYNDAKEYIKAISKTGGLV